MAESPIADLQIEYSLVSRSPENEIFPVLSELGIGLTAYGVLSRGLLSGSLPTGPTDLRTYLPRFSGDNLERNKQFVTQLQAFATARGLTSSQLAIAWVLAKGPSIVAVIGARKRSQLQESLGALAVQLSATDLADLEALVAASPIAGARYDAHGMRALDSEK